MESADLRAKVLQLQQQLEVDKKRTENALVLLAFLESEVRKLRENLGFKSSIEDETVNANPGEAVKEGELDFKPTLKGEWTKGYFVLRWKQSLVYYEQKGDAKPVFTLPLVNAKCFATVELHGDVKPLYFNIRTETGDLVLKAGNAAEKKTWVKLLKDCCFRGQATITERDALWERPGSRFLGRTADEVPAKKK